VTAVEEARRIHAWVMEDPLTRAADGLAQLDALTSDAPELLDIGEALTLTADAAAFINAGGGPGD
jgi:hypothetical protein